MLELQLNIEYFKGRHGIMKVIQLVVGIVLICIEKSVWLAIPVYAIFFASMVWAWIHFLSVPQKFASAEGWACTEFYYTGGATAAYGLTLVVSFFSFNMIFVIFGVQATIAYAVGTYFLFQDHGSVLEKVSQTSDV